MPTEFDDDQTPIVKFDLQTEISAFLVFRQLRNGRPILLVDVREGEVSHTLEGAVRLTDDFEPPGDATVVLFDEDGSEAVPLARKFQAEGHGHVKALFGGLELWKFSLDPEVVGQETYLIEVCPSGCLAVLPAAVVREGVDSLEFGGARGGGGGRGRRSSEVGPLLGQPTKKEEAVEAGMRKGSKRNGWG